MQAGPEGSGTDPGRAADRSVIMLQGAVPVSAYCEEDPWEKYYLRMEDGDNKIIPVGCVLTMVGTGSEMNGGSASPIMGKSGRSVTYSATTYSPKFSILNPVFTFTLPKYQMTAGFFDIMSAHLGAVFFRGGRQHL